MRVLVTGVSGLIGSNLAVACVQRGWHVVGTRNRAPVDVPGTKTVHLEMGNATGCRRLALAERPDVVIHAAASVELGRLQRDERLVQLNIDGAENMARAAQSVEARYALVSSDWVFSGRRPPSERWAEEDPPAPTNAYGRSKLAAERIAKQSLRPCLITRPGNVYGVNLSIPKGGDLVAHVWTHSSLALRWVQMLQSGRTLKAPGSIYQCPTYAWDYAQRMCSLIADGESGTWNLAGPIAMDRRSYLQCLAVAFDCDPDLVIDGTVEEFLRQGGDDSTLPLPANTSLSDAKAASKLGPAVDPQTGHGLMRKQLERVLAAVDTNKENHT